MYCPCIALKIKIMTKRIILALSLLLGAMHIGSSQLSVGGIIGFNIASINVKPDISSEDYKSRGAVGIGAVVEYKLMDNLSARAEPMIIGKGASVKENGDKRAFAVSYLEIPLLIKYDIELSNPDFVPYALAGPSIGFLTSANVKYNGNKSDIRDETKGIDFSFTFGAGLQVPQGNFTPFAEVRYSLGFSNINAEADDDPNESKVRNRGLFIGVGVLVPLDIN